MEPSAKRWYFSKQELEDSPSRRCGMDAEKELSNRQQAANFIQDMGQRLQVTQLCINTAIVYMHRFYCFHSFTHFHRNSIAAAAVFLAAKVEEQPRKLEHIIKVVQMCLQKTPSDRRSEAYLEQSTELTTNEHFLLMTLGFEVAIEHPHAFIVKFCHLANASKDLSHTSYFMASNSLHLTPMCVQYPPTVVACFCIYLACLWAGWQIPMSKENRPWFSYIDPSVTEELLERLTKEFLVIFDKCPSRLKKKIQNCQNGQGYVFDADRRQIAQQNQQHAQASSSSSSTKPLTLCAPLVANGSKMHPSSSSSTSTSFSSSNAGDNVVNKLPSTKNAVISPQNVKSSSSHPGPSFSGRPSLQHLSKSSNPHHANLPTSAIKPHTVSTGPSNVVSKHSSDAVAHNVFTKDAGLRSEQRRAATDIKQEPGLSSASPTSSSTVNNHHHMVKPNTSSYVEQRYRRETAPPPPAPNTDPAPPSRANFASTSEHDIIQHVVKEVVSKQEEKQRLSSSLKSQFFNVENITKPTHENLNIPSSSKMSKNPSIFSPPPVSRDDVTQLSAFDDRKKSLLKEEPLSPEMQRVLGCNASSSTSGERELIPAVKKEDDVAGLEKTATKVSDIEGSPKQELRDDRNSTSDASHSHKKKKKHKEKDKKHDKEKHRHKEKKKHKEEKYKKEHKEKRPSKEPETISVAEPVSESIAKGIKVTIRKDRLQINDIPDIPKLKINLNNQVVTPSVSDSDENLKLKINKEKVKSRKRHRDSESEGSSRKYAYNGSDLRNGY